MFTPLFSRLSRGALVLALAGASSGHAASAPLAGAERFFFGTYTLSGSVGIYQSGLDLGSGVVTNPTLAVATGNPSYVVLHPSGNYLYAVNEETAGYVVAFSVNRTNGVLSLLNQQSCQGDGPCHLALDQTGNYVVAANYNSGSVTMFPILTNGWLGTASAHIQHSGVGPHCHCTVFDPSNHFAFVCDLGLDEVFSYRFDPVQGTLITNTVPGVFTTGGAGPRHLAFDAAGRHAYLVCELNSTVVSFNYDAINGVLIPFQTNSVLPAGVVGLNNHGAEIAIHPSGRFLYVSNRTYNGGTPEAGNMAVFSVDAGTGVLTLVQQVTVGNTPRQFAIDPTGAFCLVADQDSNDIRIYTINPQTGLLTANGQTLSLSQPVCILPQFTQPPQPVLTLQPTATNMLQINVGNAVGTLTYALNQALVLPPGTNWMPLATGMRGQSNFLVGTGVPLSFFRASVVTNY